MFRLLLACTLLLLAPALHAQIFVAESAEKGRKKSDNSPGLSENITLFVLQEKDYRNKEIFEEAIRASWTLTPFRVITEEEKSLYYGKEGYLWFGFGGQIIQRVSRSGMTTTNTHLSYDLYRLDPNRKGTKLERSTLASFQLHPDMPTYRESERIFMGRDAERKFGEYVYRKSIFNNWGPGFLRTYLKVINDMLVSGEGRRVYKELNEKLALKPLIRDTLYIPDYVTVRMNPLTGKVSEPDTDDEDIKKVYPFPHKFVSSEQLNEMILSGKKFFYLNYVKSSTDKYINVFNNETGQMIYAEYVPVSYNFRNKDLSRLSKLIR